MHLVLTLKVLCKYNIHFKLSISVGGGFNKSSVGMFEMRPLVNCLS